MVFLVLLRTLAILCVIVLIVQPVLLSVSVPDYDPALYLDSSKPIEDRVESLLSQMTLKEKIGQMALVEYKSLATISDVADYHLGGLLSGAGSKPATNTPEAWVTMVAGYQTAAKSTRLGIPLLYGADAIHGQGHVEGLTVFPHAIGLGATYDTELVEAVAKATAVELSAIGVNWNYVPNLDVPYDIRWGRVYETYGDDVANVTALGAAAVRGYQHGLSEGSSTARVLATPKHYVGLGSMRFDTSSNKNFLIDQGMTSVDMKALQEMYLPPFQAAIDAGALGIMAGLNTWGSTKISASHYLLTDVLKGELGFSGFVVSDWYGVYEIPGSKYRATIKAINAGVDMVMLPFEYKEFTHDVLLANRLGVISDERIDDAVRRILRAKFTLGLFDTQSVSSSLPSDVLIEHRNLAREAVAASAVLLKNDGEVLPLRTTATTSILVAGSAADNTGLQSGAWTIEWQGVSGNVLQGATSIWAGLADAFSNASSTIMYEDNLVDAEASTRASVGIAVVGETPYAEGWGDREYPTLSYDDIETIKQMRSRVDKLVVVIVSGRPLLIEDELPLIDALVAVWLPGAAGEGVADVLTGAVPFTGRLPMAWPLRSEQLPLNPDGTTADMTTLLFSSGFGLISNGTSIR